MNFCLAHLGSVSRSPGEQETQSKEHQPWAAHPQACSGLHVRRNNAHKFNRKLFLTIQWKLEEFLFFWKPFSMGSMKCR
jgi:hypothetical protein